MAENYPKITSFKTADAFRAHLKALKLDLEIDDAILPAPESPLAQGLEYHGRRIGNRWCILPMEGWDCLPDGAPSELTRRRWLNFAASAGSDARHREVFLRPVLDEVREGLQVRRVYLEHRR